MALLIILIDYQIKFCSDFQNPARHYIFVFTLQKHDAEIINIDIASSGKFIMTCSNDTSIKIWDLKGKW